MTEISTNALVRLLAKRQDEDDQDVGELLAALLESKKSNPTATTDMLREKFSLYKAAHQFKEGDIVKWKPGLKDRKIPHEGDPAIVVRVLDEPVFDVTAEPGTPYFREPYDIVLGVIQVDGQFITYHYNSQRFEPFDS
ncbi:hypothetical protein [Methylomonas methanica]|uniref:Uncharacterized protein n=1 Tax=Methylomonas methanica (strain DSM 25384 / MC09) TaxID=857087 RepID=G0A7J1_METMM|nr:hypothetical protein [Methylomonas methanica]AEG00661.1 hypothetical protein Metme_2257 [Methylomonas methanica MC09]